jgi:hypothetical protein
MAEDFVTQTGRSAGGIRCEGRGVGVGTASLRFEVSIGGWEFRFSGLEMVGMKEGKKVERGVMGWQTRGDFSQFLQVSLGGRRTWRVNAVFRPESNLPRGWSDLA